MGVIEDLAKMPPLKIFVYVLAASALIIPGISFLYFFNLELFKNLSVIKPILVSLILNF